MYFDEDQGLPIGRRIAAVVLGLVLGAALAYSVHSIAAGVRQFESLLGEPTAAVTAEVAS